LLAAGVGDLASNLVAVADWRLAGEAGRDNYDEFAALIGEAAGQMIWDLPSLTDQRRAGQVARGLLLSGVAMATAGTSRPCSGGEHLISHALDALLGSNASPHGVQVALGTLMLAKPHGFDLPKLRSVLRSCGVPVTLEEAGIDLDIMKKAVEIAPSMRPDRYTVLNELAAAGMTPEALVHDLLP
jgi:glycerol-1-phosphate dehydrogenase [NAD(P)+]